ncbi:fungal-specific transcription factor domain-containing protein [Hypoxylon sp. FL1150]|nr:fungal-specific transcription factor domain-containing protein [Hypoxylon sp. FL1150]
MEDIMNEDRQDAHGESIFCVTSSEPPMSSRKKRQICRINRRIQRRAAMACNRCKTRKQNCDVKFPTCSPCLVAGATCVHSDSLVELRDNQLAPAVSQPLPQDDAGNKSYTHIWGTAGEGEGEDIPRTSEGIPGDQWRSTTEAWPRLVNVFFTHRWPQLPVIHKPIQRHFTPLSLAEFEDSLSTFQVSIVLAIAAAERSSLASDGALSHRDHFEVAVRNLGAVFAAEDIDCIQCLLLLCMYGSHEPQSVDLWHTIGLALRLAVGIDLHRQESIEGLNVLEAEMRKRLWWSVYVMDRSMSVPLGRPLGIQDSDITMPLPESLTDDQLAGALESPIVPNRIPSTNDTSTFIHIIKLWRIYTNAYKVFYPAGQTSVSKTDDLKVIRHEHLLQFNEWLTGAPRYLNQTCMFQTPEWFQIAYHQAVITLHHPLHISPVNTIDETRLCIDSSISLISCYGALYAKNKITFNFTALNSLLIPAFVMLRSLRASPLIRQELTKPVAEYNIRLCAKLLRDISSGRAVGESSAQIIERLGEATLNIFDDVCAESKEFDFINL